jgi:hypothetical protein
VRKTFLLVGLAGVLAASPAMADPACYSKRVTGAVLGGLGGGAIGAAAAAGIAVTPWAWAAAGVGALIGHAIGVSSCRHGDYGYYDRPYDRGYDGYPPPPPRPYPYAYGRYERDYGGEGDGYYARGDDGPGYDGSGYDPYRRGYDGAGDGYDRPAPPPPPRYPDYSGRGYDDSDQYEGAYAREPRG